MGLQRIIRKDLKKFARLVYQGKTSRQAFDKCTIVNAILNNKYKNGTLKRKEFERLLLRLSDLNINLNYTQYEEIFLNEYCDWYNTIGK